MTNIAPSLLAANWDDISKDLDKICRGGATWVHFDVMDGKFVPATTFNPEQLKLVSDTCGLIADVHLMVDNPLEQVRAYAPMGADYITFHIEATNNATEVIEEIRKFNCKPGITLKPGTKLETITQYLNQVELVLVMTVEPGKGGQSFMEDQLEKVRELDRLRDEHGFTYLIEVDGGINAETSKLALDAGANVLVSGSYIFKADDVTEAIESLQHND